ncbi:hypothetical protein B0T10DRAFT_572379 [Thelonectria olida]|uniref:Uncharacterized protein n=1 Tax=Thelonectria olida TaxID=1576542 RepID=A0A9P9AGB4_9HYPO|nr:hypothetical protein B0T10DRAFT_572379 [Thelonectria olida]
MTGAPPSTVGWLQVLTTTDHAPRPTEITITMTGAPPSTVGWLQVPTTTELPTAAPAPDTGWLLLNEDGWLSAESAYFIGTFLPVLLASIFSIPWKILDLETKSLEPFAQLARRGGGRASQTLLLQYNGVYGLFSAFTALFTGHSAVALSTFLNYSSALLIPLATESVRLTLQGECLQDWTKHCTAALQATDPVIRAAQALLSAMACVVIAYIVLLRKRTFGVSSDPRTMLGIASHSLNPYLSAIMRRISLGSDGMFSAARAAAILGERIFEFGYVTNPSGEQEYGIIVIDDVAKNPAQMSDPPPLAIDRGASKRSVVFGMLVKVISFAIFMLGLIILILYYRLTYEDSGFERFMNSQSKFGARFLFTVFGVITGFGWVSIFNELAMILPAWAMSRRPTKPKHSILMPLSPNPYVGITTYFDRGHKLLALVSVVTVLSDFLPIVLANIPFNNAITWTTFNVCTWLSVGVLGFMVVVLAIIAGIILFSSPGRHFPFASTDLGTLAAILYLACRSEDCLAQLQSLSVAGKAEIEQRMKTLKSKYSIISVVDEDGNPHVTIQVTL